jgi:hypothetical protein
MIVRYNRFAFERAGANQRPCAFLAAEQHDEETAMRRTDLAFVVLTFGAIAVAGDAPPAPALSKIMPADDLIAQARIFYKSLFEMSADEQTWRDNAHKVVRDAQTLAAVALTLGLYDSDHELKTAAPAIMASSQALAEAKEYGAVQDALKALAAALENPPAVAERFQPRQAGSMGQLMKQAGFAHNRIKRGLRRIADKTDEKARDAAVLAAIGQAIVYGTEGAPRAGKSDQWYQLCGEMRDGAGKLNAAVRAADKEGAEQAYRELERTCNACHAAFRSTK